MSARLWSVLTLLVFGGAALVVLLAGTPWQTPAAVAPSSAISATDAADFTAEERAREDAYHRDVRPPAYTGLALTLLVALAMGFTPLGARLVRAVSGESWSWILQAAAGALALAVVVRLATLPFAVWTEHVRRRYELSTATWSSWSLDMVKGFALIAAVVVVGSVVVVAVARAIPRAWPPVLALAGAALVVALSFTYPLVVEPLFNRFTPMAAGPLRVSLLELAQRDGTPVQDVLVADASRRTGALNAYVSGFGSTRRIVVYDTLLERASREEVELVLAHELAHVKQGDVWWGTFLAALGAGAVVGLVGLVLTTPGLLRRSEIPGASAPTALALVLATVSLASSVVGPLQQLVSRRVETRADLHALALTGKPAAFAVMQRRLAVENLSDLNPSPLVFGLFASHPTPPQRIDLARSWARGRGTVVAPLAPRTDPPPPVAP